MDETNLSLIHYYIKSENLSDFTTIVQNNNQYLTTEKLVIIYSEIESLLLSCNKLISKKEKTPVSLSDQNKWDSICYNIYGNYFEIHYSCSDAKRLIHPQFQHLVSPDCVDSKNIFHIDKNEDHLHLFINRKHIGSYSINNPHLLQGQFAINLLSRLTGFEENEWLGTFHASTISNNHQAIMLIGESGQGKSTLSAILMASGFNLIADDFTPVLAKNQSIYNYPSAISIKQGAFETLKNYIKDFDKLEVYQTKTSKGNIRYLPPQNGLTQDPMPCDKIVLVNYDINAQTCLEEVSIELVLKTLIPDSWLSPEAKNAEYFLNWLEKITFYKLTYSDNDEVIKIFKELFNN
jgi:hypothetical protein